MQIRKTEISAVAIRLPGNNRKIVQPRDAHWVGLSGTQSLKGVWNPKASVGESFL